MAENKLAQQFQAKWNWARNKSHDGKVYITGEEMNQIIGELDRLELKVAACKKLIIQERQKNATRKDR